MAEMATVLAVNALPKDDPSPAKATVDKSEERVSLFWRIFGGTLLSIVALAVVTLYQQLAGGLSDVRHEIDSRTKKDEFIEHRNKIWERLREMEIKEEKVDESIRESCVRLEQQLKDADEARKDMVRELQWLRETTVAALKERSAQVEQQVKMGKDDYKELVHELQQLRERLAIVEGHWVSPPSRPPGVTSAQTDTPEPR
jgi:hypothetical protein